MHAVCSFLDKPLVKIYLDRLCTYEGLFLYIVSNYFDKFIKYTVSCSPWFVNRHVECFPSPDVSLYVNY